VNQAKKPTPAVTMDARKFLHEINESEQSRVAFFERVIRKLGEEQGQNWHAIALRPDVIYFEDVDKHVYFQAAVKRDKSGKLTIEDVKKVNVVEEKKEQLFNQFCSELVGALSEDDQRKAELAFNKIESCRFRPNVIPASGWVRTRDGRSHYVPVADSVVAEDKKAAIVAAAVRALKSEVQVSEGRLVSATIVEAEGKRTITLPIDELTRRRVVARNMRAVAEGAWRDLEFQGHVQAIAALVSESKVNEGVEYAAKFLKEYQEFSLLDRAETKQLLENALAATGCFNGDLVEDVATLFFKTSLRINHKDIVESWRKTALKTEFAPLLEEINLLEKSEDFEADYGKFLKSVFLEAADVREVRRLAYSTAMKLVKNVIDVEDQTVVEQLQDLIDRLETPEVDDATLREAEDLLASISEELMQAVSSLDDFDKIPGGEEEEGEGELPPLPGEEEMGELPPPPGAPAAEVPAPAPAGPMPEPPLESVDKKNIVPISEMDEQKLSSELACWMESHETYVAEDGIGDCLKQLNEYVDRAEVLGKKDLAEKFQALRDQHSVIAEKSYFGVAGLQKPGSKINPDYKKVGTQPMKGGAGSLKDEGVKMDVQGGKAIGKGAPADAGSKMDVKGGSSITKAGGKLGDVGHKMDVQGGTAVGKGKLGDEGEKMDVQGGTAIGKGKMADAGHEMERVDGSTDDGLAAKGKGPSVKGIAEEIADAMDGVDKVQNEGRVCECGMALGEDELICPKCKGAGKTPPVGAVPPTPPAAPGAAGKKCGKCGMELKTEDAVCPGCKEPEAQCKCHACGEVMECESTACLKCGAKRMSEDQLKNPQIKGLGLKRSQIAKEGIEDDIDSALAEVLKADKAEEKKVEEVKAEEKPPIEEKKFELFKKKGKKDGEEDEDDEEGEEKDGKKKAKKGNPFAKGDFKK